MLAVTSTKPMSKDPMSSHHRLDRFRPAHHHRRIRRQYLALAGVVLIGLLAFFGYRFRQQLGIWYYERTKPATLPTTTAPEPDLDPLTSGTPTITLAAELNLAVPFTSQAPKGIWDPAHEEYCEEASAIMAAYYFQKKTFASPDEADAEMMKLETWQRQTFGYFESTTAAETKQMIETNFELAVELETTVTATTIKQALNENKLVLVPAAGRELGNPYFTAPGPIYHMYVIKGYTADGRFITNDPGTRHGADYVYSEATVLGTTGDYNHGDPANGQPVLIIVSAR